MWAVFRLSEIFTTDGNANKELCEQFSRNMIEVILSDEEDLFDELCSFQIDLSRKRMMESFEAKPGIWGFSIDIRKWIGMRKPIDGS